LVEGLKKGKQIVGVCKSGLLASAVASALHAIGFNNVSILNGGFNALNGNLNPKTANIPAETENKTRFNT